MFTVLILLVFLDERDTDRSSFKWYYHTLPDLNTAKRLFGYVLLYISNNSDWESFPFEAISHELLLL